MRSRARRSWCSATTTSSLDPDAVRVMVEEAYRSNAAIVGPKFVDYDHPEVLVEVGMAIDHYAVPFSVIEPGEIDQEQHDGVRDVFFVSHATMLVRADLFRELDGFDAATAPGSDDIDLCWRARLLGARVLVDAAQPGTPSARDRGRRTPDCGASRPQEARAATQARVRVLVKSYSAVALLWVLPSGFVLTLGEAVALALTGRWRHALAVVTGLVAEARELLGSPPGPAQTPTRPPGRRRRRPRPHGAGQRADPRPARAAPARGRSSRRRRRAGRAAA